MSSKIYGPEEKAKLEELISAGLNVNREIDDLRESLKESVKSVADELEIKPSIINKAIRIAYKGDWDLYNQDFEEIEAILDITKNK